MKYRTLRIGLTNNCSLACFYCSAEGHKASYSLLNRDNVKKIVMIANDELGIERIKYTGGEPLLFDGLSETIEEINEIYNGKIKQSIVTNGTKNNILEGLINKHKNLEITISIPALDFKTFKKLTRKNEDYFVNIENSLEMLIKSKRQFKINYVLVKGINDTDKHIENILNKAKLNKNVNLRFLELIKNKANEGLNARYLQNDNEFIKLLNEKGFSALKLRSSRSVDILKSNDIIIKYIKSFCTDKCLECPEDKTSLWITPEGIISNCCNMNFGSKQFKIDSFDIATVKNSLLKFNTK